MVGETVVARVINVEDGVCCPVVMDAVMVRRIDAAADGKKIWISLLRITFCSILRPIFALSKKQLFPVVAVHPRVVILHLLASDGNDFLRLHKMNSLMLRFLAFQ